MRNRTKGKVQVARKRERKRERKKERKRERIVQCGLQWQEGMKVINCHGNVGGRGTESVSSQASNGIRAVGGTPVVEPPPRIAHPRYSL